jgi:UDP:flavonoid glycosyltransferase YjiC (YdhE family)
LGGEPVLGAFDPVLSPAPPDGITRQVTGYWRVTDAHMALSSEVQAFFAKDGPAPAYLGFGSMRGEGAVARLEELASTLAKAGHRVIVGAGWSGAAARLPEGCIILDDAPHDLLFPHVAAAIHHGGAGTTHAAASAGVPQIIIPHLGDQFYHGARIAQLGLGPAPIPLEDLTAEQLLRVVEVVVSDPSYMDRAAAFGGPMRAREGSARAAALLSGL